MKSGRRKFVKSTTMAGGAVAGIPISSCIEGNRPRNTSKINTDYSALDEVLKKPVLKRSLFPDPVIIETLELFKDRKNAIPAKSNRNSIILSRACKLFNSKLNGL